MASCSHSHPSTSRTSSPSNDATISSPNYYSSSNSSSDEVDVDVDVDVVVSDTALDAVNAKWSALTVGGYASVIATGATDSPSNDDDDVNEERSNDNDNDNGKGSFPLERTQRMYVQGLQRLGVGVSVGSVGRRRGRQPVRCRRQSPLVNAGYALRMALVTAVVRQFVDGLVKRRRRRDTQSDTENCDNDNDNESDKDGDDAGPGMNLICLGGGLDSLGIWVASVANHGEEGKKWRRRMNVHVYDLDGEDNVTTKRRIMEESGLWSPTEPDTPRTLSSSSSSSSASYKGWSGSIDPSVWEEDLAESQSPTPTYTHTHTHPHGHGARASTGTGKRRHGYTFVSLNLRDVNALDNALYGNRNSDGGNGNCDGGVIPRGERDRPTLVVSELCLAYLGGSTDRVLRQFATRMFPHSCSAFVAYEPLEEKDQDHLLRRRKDVGIVVRDGFNDRLKRARERHGRGHGKDDDQRNEERLFHGVGPETFRQAGFRQVYWATASEVATQSSLLDSRMVRTVFRNCPEPFDEHFALSLHLQSYALTVAFPSSSSLSSSPETPHTDIFPFLKDFHACRRNPHLDAIEPTNENDVVVVPLTCPVLEEEVRTLFRTTYHSLGRRHAPIRKMVKNSCKADLSEKQPTEKDGDHDHRLEDTDTGKEIIDGSAVGNRYRSWGGNFWVAIASTADVTIHEHDDPESVAVVGFVGLRPTATKKRTTFVVRRLAVDGSRRRRGVGRALLRVVEDFCRSYVGHPSSMDGHSYTHTDTDTNTDTETTTYTLTATTPTVSTEANLWYIAQGFRLVEEHTLTGGAGNHGTTMDGNGTDDKDGLVMRTFARTTTITTTTRLPIIP